LNLRVPIAVSLALALFLAIGGAISWWWWREILRPPVVPNMQPILDKNQLEALQTYKRRCQVQEDCEKPFLCMVDMRIDAERCMASECNTSAQCQPGFMCTPFYYDGTPSIGLCLVEGMRKEGERCERFPLREDQGCGPGLLCAAGFCSRPCSPGAPSSCSDGYVCHEWNGVSTCLPSCLRSACLPDQRCIRLKGDFAVCATIHGQDCEKHPCPAGEECLRGLWWRSPPQVVNMWCARPCDEDGKPCPGGSACVQGGCERLCDESAPGTCDPGEKCMKTFVRRKSFYACHLSP